MNNWVAILPGLITGAVALLISIIGYSKIRAEAKAAESSAVKTYSEAAINMAKQTEEFRKRVELQDQRMEEMDAEIKDKSIEIDALRKIILKKDTRIGDLEGTTKRQEKEITALRSELKALRGDQENGCVGG